MTRCCAGCARSAHCRFPEPQASPDEQAPGNQGRHGPRRLRRPRAGELRRRRRASGWNPGSAQEADGRAAMAGRGLPGPGAVTTRRRSTRSSRGGTPTSRRCAATWSTRSSCSGSARSTGGRAACPTPATTPATGPWGELGLPTTGLLTDQYAAAGDEDAKRFVAQNLKATGVHEFRFGGGAGICLHRSTQGPPAGYRLILD